MDDPGKAERMQLIEQMMAHSTTYDLGKQMLDTERVLEHAQKALADRKRVFNEPYGRLLRQGASWVCKEASNLIAIIRRLLGA